MKDIFQKFKTPIIIIAVLAVGFIFYNMFFKGDSSSDAVSTTPTQDNSSLASFLPLLLQVQDIQFNNTFFSDNVYSSLKDFSQTIVPEDKERDNPFAPLEGVSVSSSTVEGLGFSVQTVSATSTSSDNSQSTQ